MDVYPLIVAVGASVIAGVPVAEKRMPFERNKEFCSLKSEVPLEQLRCDAGHDIWETIQSNRLPEDVRIGAQALLPEAISRNDYRFCGIRRESRSPRQRHANRLKVVGGDKHCRSGFRCHSSRNLDTAFSDGPACQGNPSIR